MEPSRLPQKVAVLLAMAVSCNVAVVSCNVALVESVLGSSLQQGVMGCRDLTQFVVHYTVCVAW